LDRPLSCICRRQWTRTNAYTRLRGRLAHPQLRDQRIALPSHHVELGVCLLRTATEWRFRLHPVGLVALCDNLTVQEQTRLTGTCQPELPRAGAVRHEHTADAGGVRAQS